MRCENCGWPYRPGTTVCEKCGSPLAQQTPAAPEAPAAAPQAANNADTSLKKTVMDSNITFQQEPATEQEPATQQCPNCMYPMRDGSVRCPHCGYIIGQDAQGMERPKPNVTPADHHAVEVGTPTSGRRDNSVLKGTVNPFAIGTYQEEPAFTLKPLPHPGERHEPKEVSFEGEEVALTRTNTDPNNSSITSKEQAIVVTRDGKWYILDRSEQKTTFVHAGCARELHDGDILLMGNRLFEFHDCQ